MKGLAQADWCWTESVRLWRVKELRDSPASFNSRDFWVPSELQQQWRASDGSDEDGVSAMFDSCRVCMGKHEEEHANITKVTSWQNATWLYLLSPSLFLCPFFSGWLGSSLECLNTAKME